MELCLNRGLVWEFLGLKLIILIAFLVKLQFVEYCYNSEFRQDSSRISSSQNSKIDLNILRLAYFLILKRRALALFRLMERSLTFNNRSITN